MFGFGKKPQLGGPTFEVGSSSLFAKNRMTPKEYGREMTRLGFIFALDQFDQYLNAKDHSPEDRRLLEQVTQNPGWMQLLYADLVAGGFLCHAKMILRTTDIVNAEVESGIYEELKSKMPGMSNSNHTAQRDITANFATAIEREMTRIDENSSVNLMQGYIVHFYPQIGFSQSDPMPTALHSFIFGLGSRFVAVCQGDFKISLRIP
jgi:hypothetical protein